MERAISTTAAVEEWRPVKGYEGLYEVSNNGKVVSLRIGRRLLRQKKTECGYLTVNLYGNGWKIKTKYVHRLVAEAFVQNPDQLTEVNHKDECKTNNISSNLEWCTRKYNINYGSWKDKVSENKSKQVEQLTMQGEHVAFYKSLKAAVASTGFCDRNIRYAIYGKYKQANGYSWRYVDK